MMMMMVACISLMQKTVVQAILISIQHMVMVVQHLIIVASHVSLILKLMLLFMILGGEL
ncbi:hypothetical protein AHAS_Ahas01G0131700 [Arachis hypogaea]